jgi:adrenodoxin-NADP+ reductase
MEQAQKAWQLGFLRSPVEFLSKDNKNLSAIGFQQTEFAVPPSSVLPNEANSLPLTGPPAALNALRDLKVRSTTSKTKIDASLAFRSVGYQSEPLDGFEELGIPFDQKLGIIPNDMHGRVLSPAHGPIAGLSAAHVPGMYCAGWVKRGPTGVIASTMDDAFHSADIVMRDWEDKVRFNENGDGDSRGGWEVVKREVARRGIRSVSWKDWEKIDAVERQRGKEKGKVREKVRGVEEMLRIVDA